jgi:hypothetical protein
VSPEQPDERRSGQAPLEKTQFPEDAFEPDPDDTDQPGPEPVDDEGRGDDAALG